VKVYITARFKGVENRDEIEALCAAVRMAKMKDFCFVRDVENYKPIANAQQLWEKTYDEIGACDALLIDVSDHPSGGRLVEAGIAYALRKPIIVVKRHGVEHKALYDGIAATIITYKDHKDLTAQLKEYDKERTFNVTDKGTLLVMFLAIGAVSSWYLSQFFIPLGLVWIAVYWLLIRHFVPIVQAFDRVVIYIPLTAIWLAGFYLLEPINMSLALAWLLVYWVGALLTLRKSKFAL
jgi:nucleoside 2-deoxyribosyltransferase